ncbi:MAG: class I SAM-dependent methyltransferase [bacterium]
MPERPTGTVTAPTSNRALTEPSFWDGRHRKGGPRVCYPNPRFNYLDFELCRVLREHLKPGAGGKALEVGCGSSIWLPFLAKEFGLEITGLDYSEEGLRVSRDILARNGVVGTLLKCDFREAGPEVARAFDVVFTLGLIEHFSDPGEVLKRLAGFLRPGGLLITWVPNTAGVVVGLSRRLNRNLHDFYALLDLPALVRLHSELGLTIVSGFYTQFLDISPLHPGFMPRVLQKVFHVGAKIIGCLLLQGQRLLPIRISSPRLSGGIVVVARSA